MSLYKIPENTEYLIVREGTSVMAWEDQARKESSKVRKESSKVRKCLMMMNTFHM